MSHNRFQKQRILIIFLAFQFLMLGGSVFAAPSVGQLQQQNNSTETTLTVPDTMLLGSSVAIEGNTLVAGAPLENNGEGAAYVFVRGADGAWNQATTLTAPNAQKEDSFGSSVAIAGDTIVVGAPEVDKDQNTFDSGAAYVFVRGVGSTWSSSPTTTLTAPNGAANDKFGSSVAIAGDTLVVGAPEVDKDQNTFNSGAAYVFVRGVGSTWSSSPTTTLTASNGAANDKFGSSVAIAGDTLVVGAPSANNFAGAAYVFKRDAGQWNQTPTQLAVPTYGGLGSSVAIAGNTLVVGAPSANNFAGVAYIFSQSGGQWNQTPTQQLTAPNAQETDFFGRSVAIAGDTLVVGAPSANNFAGAAYVFKRDAGQWDLQASLKASNTTQGDYFGSSVAVTGDIYVAGAPGRNQGEGAVYVFKGLPSPGFSINDMQLYVSEGIGTVTFIVTRNGLIANAVSVDVATADGTAEAGKDYTALATTLNFATNETTQTVKVTINPDTTVESDETFFVELSNPSAGAVIHDGRKKMTIIDDDSPTSVLSPTPPPTPVPVKPLTFTATSSGTPLMIPNTQKLGNSVTLSGNTLVVGAPWENSGAGTAYVFVRGADGTWSQSAQLIAPVGGSFGWSVAIIAADSVVVGSPWENGGEGAAYVFVRGADGTWSSPTQLAAPNAQETDYFGSSVAAIAADTVVVGASGKNNNAGAAYVFVRGADGTWSQPPTQLAAPNAQKEDYFGSSVAAIAADTVVVGASGKNNNAGAAYVFVRGADGTWSQPPTQLAAPNAQKEDYFGSSVAAIAADTVVVGASGKNNNAGAAYVFVRGADGTWSQPPTPLTAPNPQEKDYFGSSVATAGNTLLVGAPGERNISMGSAHVFVRDADGTWSQSAKVEPLVVGGSFGSSVAISNDTLVVGAPAENNGAGAAYVFKRPLISGFSINDVLVNENDGTATFTVTRSGLITNAVSVDVATADGTAEAGEDYIALTTTLNFAANETTQTVEVTINPDTTVEPDKTFFVKLSNPSAGAVIHDGEGLGTIMNDDIAPSPTPTPAPPVTAVTTTAGTSFKAPNIQRLGSSVAIEGNILVVGAPWGNSGAGTAHVFVRGADGTWSSPTQLAASAGGSFGSSVTIEGNILVGGAPWENNGEGAAYVFVRGADGTWSSPTQLAAPAGGSFGSSVAIEGNILVVGAPLENNGEGAAYVFVRGADGTWSSPTQLAAPPPGGSFGSSVTLSGNTLVVGAPLENNGAGTAYVFVRGADGTWSSPTQLAAPPPGGSFGSSVTLSGNTLVVGAPAENNNAGAAHVFVRGADGTWSSPTQLAAPAGGSFGSSVTLSGNTLVVGAPWENNGAGAAYVFARGADGTWISPTQLAAPAGGSFGSSVTLSGNTLVVGAPAENNDAGAAYVFKRPLISGFSINDVLVNENDGTATFTVTRSGLITNAVSVDVATADGTAEAGEDYTALTTTLNFAINETTQTVEVRINPDTTVEPDETFFVKLSNPSAGAVIHDEEGLGTIMNDDIVPSPTPVKPTPMTPTSTPVGDAPPCSTVPSVLPRDDGKPHAPQNMCVSLRQGQPRIVWSHDPNAQWFNFFIVDPNGNWQVNNQWFSIEGALLTNSELSLIDCDPGKVCTLDLPKTLPLIGPGRYELWMRAWGVPGGKGSFESGAWGTGGQTYDQFNLVVFDIPTTRPKHPTNMTVANANGEGPSVGWQAADGVIWYQLWIGRQLDKTTYVNHHFMSWAFAGDLGCSERGSRCEVKLPMPLSDGSNRLPAGTYQVWVNSWGPAGFAENDDPKLQGWRKIIELSVKE